MDFNEPTYAAFFREHKIDINATKYQFNGSSKMKRLRAFLEIEPDTIASQILAALLDYACAIADVPKIDRDKAMLIINRLGGKPNVAGTTSQSAEEFLKQEFLSIDLARLNIDGQLQSVIEQRLHEIQRSLKAETSLATIFLCGSTLEGLLLDAATKHPEQFNAAKSAPKDREGKVRQLHDWTLESLINAAHEVGFLSLDVKKYGHTLKDFRNYIHPRQQAVQGFRPDQHTAKISWQVLQASVADLSGQRKK
ncbi:hypothetical protein CAter282_3756 [Collimonas arenae]|uniref:Uncharacterized protein n=1 Tax=Collimonas arenae TaxID=279058 RepID=A0A127PUN3_9BURK|nr:hypothetical protein CAter10_4105 [Collimonas arenae]AMP11434.1 hypothetical protein CAter282_3756 [Collimonas arenae]